MKESFSREEISQLKKSLPLHGISRIAQQTGTSKVTVYKFFSHKKIRSSTAKEIVESALKVIQEDSSYIGRLKLEIEKLSKKEDGIDRE